MLTAAGSWNVQSLSRRQRRRGDVKTLPKTIFASLLLLILTSCSTGMVGSSSTLRADPQIFRVGELEVRLYQDREKMTRDLPPALALSGAMRIGGKQLQILGYYDEQHKRIFSVNDARVLLHEIKHYLEPHWRHEIGANSLDALGQGIQSACVDCVASTPEKKSVINSIHVNPSR
jgi:hypothetical protein